MSAANCIEILQQINLNNIIADTVKIYEVSKTKQLKIKHTNVYNEQYLQMRQSYKDCCKYILGEDLDQSTELLCDTKQKLSKEFDDSLRQKAKTGNDIFLSNEQISRCKGAIEQQAERIEFLKEQKSKVEVELQDSLQILRNNIEKQAIKYKLSDETIDNLIYQQKQLKNRIQMDKQQSIEQLDELAKNISELEGKQLVYNNVLQQMQAQSASAASAINKRKIHVLNELSEQLFALTQSIANNGQEQSALSQQIIKLTADLNLNEKLEMMFLLKRDEDKKKNVFGNRLGIKNAGNVAKQFEKAKLDISKPMAQNIMNSTIVTRSIDKLSQDLESAKLDILSIQAQTKQTNDQIQILLSRKRQLQELQQQNIDSSQFNQIQMLQNIVTQQQHQINEANIKMNKNQFVFREIRIEAEPEIVAKQPPLSRTGFRVALPKFQIK
ncbi:Hypothetical_protein [Hexamita inflata]|uniref:Hypothetical_protein n=1 Tax=Hexamita inflata TaxID=28002 RepID=A0AA86Q8I7_9EUKA|nr:Hypothetical protein HINF_LOCUS41885 [Hexamita inflata]